MQLNETRELKIQVSVTARPGTRFEAKASCAFGGERFEETATDASASAALAMANAVGRVLQSMQARHAKFTDLGPDVLLRKKSKRLRADLGGLFQHPDPPYPSAPWARPRYSLPPSAPPGPGPAVGELVDRAEDELAEALEGEDDADDADDNATTQRRRGRR